MNRIKGMTMQLGRFVAATALAAGVSSSQKACWVWFCQPKVPAELKQFKRHKDLQPKLCNDNKKEIRLIFIE